MKVLKGIFLAVMAMFVAGGMISCANIAGGDGGSTVKRYILEEGVINTAPMYTCATPQVVLGETVRAVAIMNKNDGTPELPLFLTPSGNNVVASITGNTATRGTHTATWSINGDNLVVVNKTFTSKLTSSISIRSTMIPSLDRLDGLELCQ